MTTEESTIVESVMPEKISEVDQLKLQAAKDAKTTAKVKVDLALAESNLAEMTYRYAILQTFHKYNMSSLDSLSEDGTIIKNGNAPNTEVK